MSLGLGALILFSQFVDQPWVRRIEKTNPGGKATEVVRDQVKECELLSKQFNNQHFIFFKAPVSEDCVVHKKSSLLMIEKITTCPECVLCSRVYSFWSCLFISKINFILGFSETKERDDKVWCGSKNLNSVCCWFCCWCHSKCFLHFYSKLLLCSLVYI